MRRITRGQAIEELRGVLLRMVDEQNSLCRVAAWRKLFCRGFSQWSQGELEQRFPRIPRRGSGFRRGHQELEANDMQLCHQDIPAGKLPCDVEPGDRWHAPCNGWDGFTEDDLAHFHREICGETVSVVPDEPQA